jgi:hypothetical protein
MSQHWYDTDGKPAYEIVGANGKLRDTTLRDARKFNYAPSTTTVIAGAAKPGLDNYFTQQLLEACLRNPMSKFICGFDTAAVAEWKKKTAEMAKEHSKNAATSGTAIHDSLEKYYLGEKFSKKMKPICEPVIKLLQEEFGEVDWQPERSFTHKLGFGGKVDMSSASDRIVLDFKTKATDDVKKMVQYDEHGMQTASYAVGLDIPNSRRYNLFISTQVPGLLNLTESTDFERDWGMFEALLKLWQLRNKYVPEISK